MGRMSHYTLEVEAFSVIVDDLDAGLAAWAERACAPTDVHA